MRSSWMLTVAAVLTTILAATILYFSASLAYYAISDPPLSRSSITAHDNFHIVEEAGFSLMAVVLLLFVAWTSLRKGEPSGVVVLVVAGLPVGVLPPLAYQVFGPWHSYVLYLPVLWLVSVAAGGAGLAVNRMEARSLAGVVKLSADRR